MLTLSSHFCTRCFSFLTRPALPPLHRCASSASHSCPSARFVPSPPTPMADAQVTAWLRCAGLSRFAPRFGAAFVSQANFLQLSSTDLDALGVDGPADRKRLHDLIDDLRRSAHLPPRASTPPRSSTVHAFPSIPSRPVLETLSHQNSSAFPDNPTSSNLPFAKSSLRRTTRRISKFPSTPSDATPASTTNSIPKPTTQSSRTMSPARVTVCVRKRPLSRKELNANNHDIIVVNQPQSSLYVHELKQKVDLTKYVETHPFTFDRVFAESACNAAVYEGTARPLVDALFSGGRSTCFAYGQTGAGKTFTMAGDGVNKPGLYTLAVRDLFDRIRRIERDQWRAAEAQGDDDFLPPDPPQVWISFFEIYAAKLQDLLNRSGKLECREDTNSEVQIVGLTERLCEVEEDVLACIDEGSAARATGVTGANDDSSRSHAVFQIELRHPPSDRDTVTDVNAAMRESLLRGSQHSHSPGTKRGNEIGRLCFIDLAGSERGGDTASSTKQTRMEGAEINKSLLALKECIRAMDQRKDHTPFRGSKLTQVLKASFTGKNCRTVMIANISPGSSNVEHTLNTLRYSDRVKEIKKGGKQSGASDYGKGFGGRRATFSHGVGLKPRQGTILPLPGGTTQNSEGEAMDLSPTEPLVSERKPPKTDRPPNVDDMQLAAQNLSRGLPRRRATNRVRARPSDASALFPISSASTSDQPQASKRTESRILRRRPSKAPSHLPTRPSLGGSMLPKPGTKAKPSGDERIARSNSGLKRRPSPPRSTDDSDSETMQDQTAHGSREETVQARCGGVRKAANSRPSGMITRRRARELESRAPDVSDPREMPRRQSKSPPPGGNQTESKKMGRPSYVELANSEHTEGIPSCQDELSDEDILYDSSDDLVSAVTAAAEMARSMGHDKDAMISKQLESDMKLPRRSSSADRNVRRISSSRLATRSYSYEGSPSTTTPCETQPSGVRVLDEKVRSVLRLHHAQIEELMRLTEADVALVNAVEEGQVDPQVYALKLSVNLSQKLDIVRALQAKARLLE